LEETTKMQPKKNKKTEERKKESHLGLGKKQGVRQLKEKGSKQTRSKTNAPTEKRQSGGKKRKGEGCNGWGEEEGRDSGTDPYSSLRGKGKPGGGQRHLKGKKMGYNRVDNRKRGMAKRERTTQNAIRNQAKGEDVKKEKKELS